MSFVFTTLSLKAQLTFEFSYGPGMVALMGSSPATAMAIGASMTDAGVIWGSSLHDPVTLKFTVDLDPTLPSSVFAAAYAVKVPTLYTSVKGALTMDSHSSADSSAVSSLQPGPHIEAITHDTATTTIPSPEIRLSGGLASDVWNTTFSVTRANLKALGLLGATDGGDGADGVLMINPTKFGMLDFSRTGPVPITPGLFDFTGIALHELGHLMGFFSGVDEVDYAGDGSPGNPTDLSGTAIFSVLDLYRYSPHSLLAESQPTTGAVNDWRFGPPPGAFLPSPALSIDAGDTVVAPFATGAEHGDGSQASHFASVVPALMNPGFGPGMVADPTTIDITAMDAIGWDTVFIPEPSAMALGALGLAIIAIPRRRRRSSNGNFT